MYQQRGSRPSRLCLLLFSWLPSVLAPVVLAHGLRITLDGDSASQKWGLLDLVDVRDRHSDEFRLGAERLVGHGVLVVNYSLLRITRTS